MGPRDTHKQLLSLIGGASILFLVFLLVTAAFPLGWGQSTNTTMTGEVVDGSGDPLNSTVTLLKNGDNFNATTGPTFNFTVSNTTNDRWTLVVAPTNGTHAEVRLPLRNKPKGAEVRIDTRDSSPALPSPPGAGVTLVDVSTTNVTHGDVTTTIPYNESRLPGPENGLEVWSYADGSWTHVESAHAPPSDTVEVTTPGSPPLALTTHYVDTFDDGNASPDWTAYTASGRWNENNTEGYLVQDSKGTGTLLNRNATGGHTEFAASVRAKKSRAASNFSSLLLRSDRTGENGVETRIDWDRNALEIGTVRNGKYRAVREINYTEATGYRLDTLPWYEARAILRNGEVRFTVSEPGAPAATVTAPARRLNLAGHRVGLRAKDGGRGDKNLFDNFTVEPLPPEETAVSGTVNADSKISLLRPDGIVAKRVSGKDFGGLRGRKGWRLDVDASESQGVRASFGLNGSTGNADVTLRNFSSNPEQRDPAGMPVAFAEVSATDLNYSDVEVRLSYDGTDLSNVDESSLTIKHYKDGEWHTVPTTVDPVNDTVTGTVTSLSHFAVTGNYEDTFDDNSMSSDWTQVSGTWSETNQRLEKDSDGTGLIVNDQADGGFLNYSVTVDEQMSGDDEYWTSTLLRSDGSGDNAVETRLDYANDQVEVGYFSGGTRSVVNSTSLSLTSGTYYTVNTTVKENNVTVYVDGVKRVEASSPNFDLTGGFVGLKGTEGNGGSSDGWDTDDVNFFDNFNVTHYEKQASPSSGGPQNVTVKGTIQDGSGNPLTANFSLIDPNGTLTNSTTGSSFDLQGKTGWTLDVNASSIGVKAEFELSGNSTNVIVTLNDTATNPAPTAPPGTQAVKFAEVSATNLNYSSATIRLDYNESDLGDVPETSLYLRHYDSGWTTVPTTLDTEKNYVEGTVSSLSPFAVTGSTNAGDPSLSADRTSSDVAPGYTITYHLTVKNEDDEADTIDLNASIDDPSWSYNLSKSSVQLDAGKSTAVDLDVTVPGDAAIGSSANVTVIANSSRDATTQTVYQTSYTHFSDDEADHDGTQPAGTGSSTATQFSDGFEDGSLDPWTTSDSDRSGVSTETSNTGTYSMYTRWDVVDVTSNTTDLSGYESATLSAWISDGASGINDPEDVESLKVQYKDSAGSWKVVEDISGSGDAGTTYDKEWTLPDDALHRDFQIRFTQTGGSGDPYDYWFIDDVTVETSTTSGDGEVELLSYSDTFDDNSLSDDWAVKNGSWTETSGELQQDNDSAGHSYNMNATGTGSIFEGAKDVNVSVDMRTDDTAYWQGLQLRSDPARNGVEVRLDYQNDQVEIADYNTNQRAQVNATSMTLSAGTWYTVNASIHGNTVHVWVDGTHRLQATNTSFHSPYRWVNLRGRDDASASSVNRFENFEVWTLNGTYTSPPLDSQHVDPDYNTSSLYFNTTIPAGTSMNATVTASSDATFGDRSDTSRTFSLTDGNSTYATDWMDGYQYVQAEVTLLTDDKSTSPKLQDWGVTRAGGTPSDAVYVETTAASPEYDVTLNVTPASEDVPPGGSYDFTVDVQNNGTIPDSYTLSKEDTGDTDFFDSSLSTGGVENLDPGESTSLTLTMTASPGTPFGSSMTTNVTTTSVGDDTVSVIDDATGHVRTKYPHTVRVVTNRYSVLDDPNSGNPSSTFDAVPSTWGSDYWTGESTTIRAYAMVQSQYGEPMENETVHFVIEDWAGNKRFDNTSQTNHAGIANATLNTNGINYWGVWKVTATAESTTDTTTFVKNWWGCADCHGDNGDPGTAYTNPSYSRSPYVEGYEESGHNDDETWDCMRDATSNGKCEYCHQDYGGGPLGTINQDTGGQTPWGTHDGKKTCPDCHTDGGSSWLANGGDDGHGLPKMPSCFSGECHNQVNPNVQPWRTTTTDKNQSQYSMIWVAGSEVKGQTIYIDKFDDGTLDPWSSTGSGTAGVTTDASSSGSYSLYVEDADGEATSDTIDLSPYSSGELNFWTDKNIYVDGSAEDLDVYYYAKDTSRWRTDYVWTKLGDVESFESTPQNVSFDLPGDAFHDQAQIRFNLQDASGESLPRWYMDDVEILTGAQKTGQPSKAHSTYENGGDVPCILCHGPMHNVTTPYPAGQGNDVTEKEQCYQCHVDTKHEFYEGISSPQPCTECHTQDIHSIRGSLRMRPRTDSAKYDNDRNLLYKVDPQWGTWQRWELAYNGTYNASADVYRDETVQSGTCESCHVGTNQKRGVHRINLTFEAPNSGEYSYFGWNGKGLDCLGCHDSKLNGSGTGQEIHSAHPQSYNGSRTRCGTCHTGEARKSGVGEVPESATTSGTYTVTVFGVNQTYDATQPQTCQQCHDDWHRNPTYDRDRFPTLSQGLNDTLQTNATTNVSALGSFPGPLDPVNSTVSPGVTGKDNCTSAPCHLKSAHEAMNPAAQGNRFPQYQPSGSPGCAACHALNKWSSHPEALTDLYSNYQEDISFRAPCDACHFEPQADEGYMSNIFKPFG